MRILIVEDCNVIAELMKRYLEPIADSIAVARTMAEAQEHLRDATSLDLVTLDLNLPDSVTKETLQAIRAMRDSNSELLVIVVTGMVTQAESEIAFAHGADGFLSKDTVSLHSHNFLTALREVVCSVIGNPRRWQKNVALLEAVAKKISGHLDGQLITK